MRNNVGLTRLSVVALVFGVNFMIVMRLHLISGQIIYEQETDLGPGAECRLAANLTGVCTHASRCPRAKLNASMSKICSFSGTESIVCCVRTSELVCNNFRKLDGQYVPEAEKHFFVGGIRAKSRQYPHMAAIGWTQYDRSVNWKCGGSLISENFILTAAHCSTDRGVAPDVVRAGVINLLKQDPDDPAPVDFNIVSILVYPDYKPPATYHDIALFRIIPVKGYTDLQPICLWPSAELTTSDLLGMGFGTVSFGGPQSNELYVGSLNYVAQSQCVATFNSSSSRRLANGIIDSQMCAQDREGKRDTCQGDSGGPLQLNGGWMTWKKNYLVGITSFGEGCLGASPGVYTRVSSYLNWIEGLVWPEYL